MGPSIIFQEAKVLALSGSCLIADCVKIKKSSISLDQVLSVTKWADLKSADSVDKVKSISLLQKRPQIEVKEY